MPLMPLMPLALSLVRLVARLAAASWAWMRAGRRLTGVLAVVFAAWAVSWGASASRAGPTPLAPRAAVVSVDVIASSGVPEATWEEPRKLANDRLLLAHALPPPPADLVGIAGPRGRSSPSSTPSSRVAVARWRSERSAIPAPRGPPRA
jgi:hypothetical protein